MHDNKIHWTDLRADALLYQAHVDTKQGDMMPEDRAALENAKARLVQGYKSACQSLSAQAFGPLASFFENPADHTVAPEGLELTSVLDRALSSLVPQTLLQEAESLKDLVALSPPPLPDDLSPASITTYLYFLDKKRSEVDTLAELIIPAHDLLESRLEWMRAKAEFLAPIPKPTVAKGAALIYSDPVYEHHIQMLAAAKVRIGKLQESFQHRYETASRILTGLSAIPTAGGPTMEISSPQSPQITPPDIYGGQPPQAAYTMPSPQAAPGISDRRSPPPPAGSGPFKITSQS